MIRTAALISASSVHYCAAKLDGYVVARVPVTDETETVLVYDGDKLVSNMPTMPVEMAGRCYWETVNELNAISIR